MRSPRYLTPLFFLLFSASQAAAQVPLPCVAIFDEEITCDPDLRPGEVEYRFKVRNISGRALSAIQLAPLSGAYSMSPSLIEFSPLAPDAVTTSGTVTVRGVARDSRVSFCVLGVGVDPDFCCIQSHRFDVGDCGAPAAPLLAPNGFQTTPCEDPVEPGTCIQICDAYIACDDRGCYYFSFAVTNRSASVMDHIFIPDANISPDVLRFPDPLDPGEAARVWVEICDALPGPYTVPIILGSCSDWFCCGLQHTIELPECPCIGVRGENIVWSTNPDGSFHIDYTATIDNRAPWDAGTIVLGPLMPDDLHVETMSHPLEGPPTRLRTVSTGIDVPAGYSGRVKILIVMHATDFSECCLLERTIGATSVIQDPPPIRIDRRPGGIALEFRAPAGQLCCVQESRDLAGADWRTIQAIDGLGQDVEMEVGANTGRPERFFRLVIGDHIVE